MRLNLTSNSTSCNFASRTDWSGRLRTAGAVIISPWERGRDPLATGKWEKSLVITRGSCFCLFHHHRCGCNSEDPHLTKKRGGEKNPFCLFVCVSGVHDMSTLSSIPHHHLLPTCNARTTLLELVAGICTSGCTWCSKAIDTRRRWSVSSLLIGECLLCIQNTDVYADVCNALLYTHCTYVCVCVCTPVGFLRECLLSAALLLSLSLS